MKTRNEMILCDTNILIEFYKNNSQIISELRYIGLNQLAVSAITQAELYYSAINNVELLLIFREKLIRIKIINN